MKKVSKEQIKSIRDTIIARYHMKNDLVKFVENGGTVDEFKKKRLLDATKRD